MQETKPVSPPSSSPGTLVPQVVKDIPMAAQHAGLTPAQDDTDLDKIMADVGQDIKQIGNQKAKRHMFSFRAGPKPPKASKKEAKFQARPIDQIKAPVHPAPPAAVPASSSPQAMAKAAQPPLKPANTSRAPIGIILLAVMVTGVLTAAAYYAYK